MSTFSGPVEGIVQFEILREEGPLDLYEGQIAELSRYRALFKRFGWFGVQDGYGYGNISQKINNGFLITGSQTSGLDRVSTDHYSLVLNWDLKNYRIWCMGKILPSSEALSHAMIYQAHPKINAVIHIHDKKLWQRGLEEGWPRTDAHALPGTQALAQSIRQVLSQTETLSTGILILKGHEDGIMAFGEDLRRATQSLFRLSGKKWDDGWTE